MSTHILPVEDAGPSSGPVDDRGQPQAPERREPSWGRQFFIAGIFSFLWACLCNATLDVLMTGGNVGRLVTYQLVDTPVIFLLSSAVVWVVWGLVFALTGRYFVTNALLFSITVVAGFANYEKLRVRNEPLLPSDIGFASNPGFLGDMVPTSTIVAVGLLVFLVLVIAILLGRILGRTFPRVTRRAFPTLWGRWMLARLVLAVVCIALLAHASNFNQSGNLARGAYERAGAHWAFWFQKVNYFRHGVVAGFLYNTQTVPMERPAGYSQDRMDQIANKYQAIASGMGKRRGGALDVADLNVVVVLSESFSDPTAIPGVELERDPIPFTRELMATNPSGSLLTQHFGGGTANMEYESLTGMSISQFTPQHDTPYSMSVFDQSSYPSIVGYMKATGHEAIGIHPYMPTMYKREGAYRALGFDDFITEDALHERRRIDDADFIADRSAFKETLIRMRDSAGPDFVNLVTMQNHYPTDDVYDDPMSVSGVAEAASSPLGHFARGLEHSDAAFKSFLAELKASDEPTAVVFYGDHQPALWDDDPEISADEEAMHRAPFVMWTNTGDLPSRKVPLVSPIHFMPMLFESLDLEMPPFYALLSGLREHVSAMENGRYYDPEGRQISDLDADPELQELLEDYRLVQYDLAVGERYSLDRMFPQG